MVHPSRRRAQTSWTRVGGNAEMVGWAGLKLDFCPYPLDVGLERFYTGAHERYATLVHDGTEAATRDLVVWFTCYNGRQTIEAGVKEGKRVFEMHHLFQVRPHELAECVACGETHDLALAPTGLIAMGRPVNEQLVALCASCYIPKRWLTRYALAAR